MGGTVTREDHGRVVAARRVGDPGRRGRRPPRGAAVDPDVPLYVAPPTGGPVCGASPGRTRRRGTPAARSRPRDPAEEPALVEVIAAGEGVRPGSGREHRRRPRWVLACPVFRARASPRARVPGAGSLRRPRGGRIAAAPGTGPARAARRRSAHRRGAPLAVTAWPARGPSADPPSRVPVSSQIVFHPAATVCRRLANNLQSINYEVLLTDWGGWHPPAVPGIPPHLPSPASPASPGIPGIPWRLPAARTASGDDFCLSPVRRLAGADAGMARSDA